MRGKIWINLTLSACTALVVLPGGTTFAQQPPNASADASANNTTPASSGAPTSADPIAAAVSVLTDPSIGPDQREDAARKLVARHSPESRAAILQILNDRPPQPRVALAMALADDPDPDTDFINPLYVMMTTEQDRPIEAARALGSYKNNPALLLRLVDFSSDPRHGAQRIYTIKALGYMVDRRAAEQLVNLLKHEDEDPGIRSASAQALGEMTGLNYGNDFPRWQQWWDSTQSKSPDQFRLDILNTKAVQLDIAQTHDADVQTHYHDFLDAEYQAAGDQQPAKLQSYLTAANDPVMEQMGAEIVQRAHFDGHPVPQQAMVQLRKMIGDSDPHVRQAVVDALQAMNDHDALQPLLAQLNQEEDPNVRASIAAAFGPIGDLQAVPPLLKLLDDRTPAVAVAAAKSLADLAPALHTSDPKTAAELAKDLQSALDRSGNTGMQSLREAVVSAMAALHDPSLTDTFRELLKPGESVSVRRNALLGLGYLNNRNDDALIGQFLSDPDPSVREAAIDAEKDVHFAPQLLSMLGPNANNPPAVQNAAWTALQGFLPEITDTQQLANFADQFRDWNQWDRRLSCLQRLASEYQKEGNHADDLADTDENIGQCQEKQSPPDYKGAAASYAAAMNIKEQLPGHNDEVISRLIDDRLKAMLLAGSIDDAIAFAQQAITKYPIKKGDIGAIITDQADDLKNQGDQNPAQLDTAISLIGGALKLNPALPQQYQYQLQQTQKDVLEKQAGNKGKNGILYPTIGGAMARAAI